MRFKIVLDPRDSAKAVIHSIHVPSEKNEQEGGHSHEFRADANGIFTVPDRYIPRIMRSHRIVEVPDPSMARGAAALRTEAFDPSKIQLTDDEVREVMAAQRKALKLHKDDPVPQEAATAALALALEEKVKIATAEAARA